MYNKKEQNKNTQYRTDSLGQFLPPTVKSIKMLRLKRKVNYKESQ